MEVYTRIWKWFFFSAYTICRVFLFILFIRENSQKTWLFELSVFIFKSPSFLPSSVVCWHLIRRLGSVSLCCSSSSLWWCLTTRWMGCVYAFRSLNLHYIYQRSVLSLCACHYDGKERESGIMEMRFSANEITSAEWQFLLPPFLIRFLTTFICVCTVHTLAFSFSELYTTVTHTHTLSGWCWGSLCVLKSVLYIKRVEKSSSPTLEKRRNVL